MTISERGARLLPAPRGAQDSTTHRLGQVFRGLGLVALQPGMRPGLLPRQVLHGMQREPVASYFDGPIKGPLGLLAVVAFVA